MNKQKGIIITVLILLLTLGACGSSPTSDVRPEPRSTAQAPAAAAAPTVPSYTVTDSAVNPVITYSFTPRLQAHRGGVDQNIFIDRVVVRGNFLNIYLLNTPVGAGGHSGLPSFSSSAHVQDLDRPQRTNSIVRQQEVREGNTQFWVLTFEGVQYSRFTLVNPESGPSLTFDEIILDEPASVTTPAQVTVRGGASPNGIYEFFPRLQAHRGGIDQSIYIDRVVVRGNFLNIYLLNTPVGAGGHSGLPSFNSTAHLQDLSRPQRTTTLLRQQEVREGNTQFWVLTFEGVQYSRFTLVNPEHATPLAFEEIVLGEYEPLPVPAYTEITPQSGAPRNGTYSFFPRLQAHRGGIDQSIFIDRVIVQGGFVNIYLLNTPQGAGGHSGLPSFSSTAHLQDLSRPQRTSTIVRQQEVREGNTQFWVLTFEGVAYSRFSLTNPESGPSLVFDDIRLGEAD